MTNASRKSIVHNARVQAKRKKKTGAKRMAAYFQQRYPRLEELAIIHRHAAGIDLGGKTSHFVALEIGQEIEVREFGMTTAQLVEMCLYLQEHEVSSVAMESTGVYWVPVCDILERAGLEVFLVNPTHAKNVPGRRKDDKMDCRWLQKLHKYGLLSASFRPAEEIRPLRSLLRHRQGLVEQLADQTRRLQKVLDMMNVRIHKAVSDLGGLTGMRIVRAIVAGEVDPAVLATLRDPRCECSAEQLVAELTGFYSAHLVKQLASVLRLYDGLLAEITRVDADVEAEMQTLAPVAPAVLQERLAADTHAWPTGKHAPAFNASAYVELITGCDPAALPGIGPQHALRLLGELGRDMAKWPTVKHFGSYLTLAPVEKISGGKLLSARTRPGTHPAAVIFRQAAAVVVKQDSSALAAFYRKVASHRGKGKALTALAYKIARMYYYLMKYGTAYVEVGEDQYAERYHQQQITALQKRAKRLGYTMTPVAA
jgi:transposase